MAELIRSVIREEIRSLRDQMNGRFDNLEGMQREMLLADLEAKEK
ncbi:hypothetical protein [Robertmurraya sp.]